MAVACAMIAPAVEPRCKDDGGQPMLPTVCSNHTGNPSLCLLIASVQTRHSIANTLGIVTDAVRSVGGGETCFQMLAHLELESLLFSRGAICCPPPRGAPWGKLQGYMLTACAARSVSAPDNEMRWTFKAVSSEVVSKSLMCEVCLGHWG